LEADTGAVEIDRARFRLLFESSYGPLVAYARRRTPDRAEADDVVSEAFTIAWRRRVELRSATSPLPWLYGIAANVIRNQRRTSYRRIRLADKLEALPRPTHVSDPAERPGADLRAALSRLSFDDQEVLRLVAWEGLSHAEVGQAVGCSTNAIGIRIHRARRRLQEELHDHSPANEEGSHDRLE
jgi:RNA polymerase sigma-70 factor (ECF subfamily)